MKVGYSERNYPVIRNIIDKVDGLDYVRVYDINKILLNPVNKKILKQAFDINDMLFTFQDFDLNRVDILHFFNAISFGKTPWITTFETVIPRYSSTYPCHKGQNCGYSALVHEKKVLNALEALSGKSCIKLIAMSECNLTMQKDLLQHFPQYYPEIEPKLTCLHPPQKVIVDSYESKQLPLDGQIHFMFVGSAFIQKGGLEILEAFQESRKNKGYNLKLTIISSLKIYKYAAQEKKEDIDKAKDIINKNADWIEYHGKLPNREVLYLMNLAHIGLLPTYADTYGYSVLEFQSLGCPVISTNIRALPEINNDEIGWVIDIPKNRLGEAIYSTEEDRAEIRAAILNGLTGAIAEIMENRQVIFHKANAAIQHIRDRHSPQEFSRRLGEIYQCGLQ